MTCTRCKSDIHPTSQPYHRTRRGAHHAVCPPLPSEAQIQQTCTGLLEFDGWRPLRTDPCSDRSTLQTLRAAITGCPALNHVRDLIFKLIAKCVRGKGFGEVGMADNLYIRSHNSANHGVPVWGTNRPIYDPTGDILWIEWKAAKGKPAAHQIAWHEAERAKGFLTLIAGVDFPASIEGFWRWYEKSGLKRKEIKLP